MSLSDEPFFIGEHYLYEGFWYTCHFPVTWAKNHLLGTGPRDCRDCAEFGTLHEGTVFVGYCVDCAVDAYSLRRGHGFIGHGVEQELLPKDALAAGPSAQDTYLADVVVDRIPPLLCDVSPPQSVHDEDDDNDVGGETNGILECHFEGGYNDY